MRRGFVNRTGFLFSVTLLVLVISLTSGSAQELKSEFVGDLPPIREVFTNLFSKFIEEASEDQLRTLIEEKFTDDEKTAIRKFLDDDGIAELRSRAAESPEKEALLDPLDKALAGKKPGLKFKDAFPGINSKFINIMSVKQIEVLYSSLDDKEMGTVSMYLDLDGLARLFGSIPPEKAEVILNHTPDWLLLETGKKKLDTMNTYESLFYKQEMVNGKQQGVEKIILKFRHKPWALYMKWIEGPFTGRECLFNEQIFSDKVRVREAGILGVIALNVSLTSSLARRGSNHNPSEIGIFYLLGMIEEDYRKAAPVGEIKRRNMGIQEVDGHKVFVMESLLPKDPDKGYYCYRMVHYIDYERSLEIKAEIFNWDDQMSEMYLYTRIKMNPPYTDADFDPENPEYDL